jgi:hypothetical protein
LTPPRLTRPRNLLATAILALAVAATSLGCGASDAKAARKMEIAIQDDNVFVTKSYFDRERAFRFSRSLGVTRLRINVTWAFMNPPQQRKQKTKPANPVYQFGIIDSAIDAAARRGIRVHLSLTGPAPAWATRNHRVGPYKPSSSAFGKFAEIAARHFKGRVDRYSIWNEGNIKPWLAPVKSSPSLYRSLYQRGYAAIKGVDPKAKVLIGETAPYGNKIHGRAFSTPPIRWLRAVLCVSKRYHRKKSCPRLRADGYAHHPYDFRHSANFRYPGNENATMGTLGNLTRALDRFKRIGALRKNGGGRMPLFLTEYGYFASGKRALSKRKRTKYLQQGWKIALRNGRVKSNLQYLLVAPPPKSSSAYFNLSLVKRSGHKYPTYNALRSWFRKYRHKVKRPGNSIALPSAPPF